MTLLPLPSLVVWLAIDIADCKKAKLQARIKPTALCLAIDKENSIEFPLDFLHYLYNYYMVCALSSHAYHVTNHVTFMWCDTVMWHFPTLHSV